MRKYASNQKTGVLAPDPVFTDVTTRQLVSPFWIPEFSQEQEKADFSYSAHQAQILVKLSKYFQQHG